MDSARRETVNPREQTEPPATTIVGDPYAGNGTGTGSGNESYVDTVKQYIAPVTESVTSQAAAPGETLKNIGAQVREIATGMVKKAETETETEIRMQIKLHHLSYSTICASGL